MAAPTSVRCEAQSMTSIKLYWAYSGSGIPAIFRSTDNVTFTYIGQVLLSTTLTFLDDGPLSSGTKYYYKLTDDFSSTFSSTVSAYTHFCPDQPDSKVFLLPRFDEGQTDQSERLNQMADRVENALGELQLPEWCIVCPSDGAVSVDCTDACKQFLIVADENINSFTINGCGSFNPVIAVHVPPNTVGRQICGFPAGYGFTGDECNEAPISGGTSGKTMYVTGQGGAGLGGGAGGSDRGTPKSKLGATKLIPGSGSGGLACECVPGENNQLTLKCCNDDCSLNCIGNKSLLIKVCGGIGPYDFTHTGSVKFQTKPDGTTADTVTRDTRTEPNSVLVVPPTNSGSATAGTAYAKILRSARCFGSGSCTGVCGQLNMGIYANYGCDDAKIGSTTAVDDVGNFAGCNSGTSTGPCVSGECTTGPGCSGCVITSGCTGYTTFASTVTAIAAYPSDITGSTSCDKRSGAMVSAGCSPCGLNSGAIVTVTDATGTSVSVTLRS